MAITELKDWIKRNSIYPNKINQWSTNKEKSHKINKMTKSNEKINNENIYKHVWTIYDIWIASFCLQVIIFTWIVAW